jgi:hypothetical protein
VANCGVSFGRGERWLIIAYVGDAGLETNRCMDNRRLDRTDVRLEARIRSLLPAVPPPPEPGYAGPPPAVIGVLALLVVSVAWWLAIGHRDRRRSRSLS